MSTEVQELRAELVKLGSGLEDLVLSVCEQLTAYSRPEIEEAIAAGFEDADLGPLANDAKCIRDALTEAQRRAIAGARPLAPHQHG